MRIRVRSVVVASTRTLMLSLTHFSRTSLEREAERSGLSIPTLLARAALYYLLERESNRIAVRVPRFTHAPQAGVGSHALAVTVELGARDWSALDRVAAREGVSVERLLEHAALLLLADLESGRLAARLLRSAEAEAE